MVQESPRGGADDPRGGADAPRELEAIRGLNLFSGYRVETVESSGTSGNRLEYGWVSVGEAGKNDGEGGCFWRCEGELGCCNCGCWRCC